jgi:hypothetical protein
MSDSVILAVISKIAEFINKSQKDVILNVAIFFIVIIYALYISIDLFDPIINEMKKNSVIKQTITYLLFNIVLAILILSIAHFLKTDLQDVVIAIVFFMFCQQFVRLLLKQWFKISQSSVNNKKNKVNLFLCLLLFLFPIFLIFLNQTSDLLVNLKYIGFIFQIVKLKTERGKYTDKIIYFYLFQMFLALGYIITIIFLSKSDHILKICGNLKKTNNEYIIGASCTSEIIDDMFLYTQLFTIFFVVGFLLMEYYTKRTTENFEASNTPAEDKTIMDKLSSQADELTNQINEYRKKGVDTEALEANLKKVQEKSAKQLEKIKGQIGDITSNFANNPNLNKLKGNFTENMKNLSKMTPASLSAKIPGSLSQNMKIPSSLSKMNIPSSLSKMNIPSSLSKMKMPNGLKGLVR